MGEEGPALVREVSGEGPAVILLHGLTAVRSQVIHGSRRLQRAGFRTVSYDARSHGDSDPPRPDIPLQDAYSYPALAEDLRAVIADEVPPGERFYLVGSSMGAHTIARYALDEPEHVAGMVLIGPAYGGEDPDEISLAPWEAMSDALRKNGPEGYVEAYSAQLEVSDEWRGRLTRLAAGRIALHRHLDALADALWWIPRSRPFDEMDDLSGIQVPALIVASDDEADPAHPRAVAGAWAEALPNAQLSADEPGATPTAWSGGRLCTLIADFARAHA
jgi:pimeloyl-ACP methyl ester carboxylesterase